jgi:uncharacterized protein YggU (UPF0235/DUF167 family)
LRLAVRVTPRGGRDAVESWARDEAGRPLLKVRVSAAAAEGAANAAVTALIARSLKLPKSAVAIVRGDAARVKQLEIEGADEADLARAFGHPQGL